MKIVRKNENISNTRGKTDLLLITRGLAALSVVLWHAGGYLRPYPDWMNVPGRTAVWLFFGLSGYVIAFGFIHGRYRLNAGDLKDFYINRFLRIYPIFLLLSFLGWLTETLRTGSSPLSFWSLPSQLFAMQFDQNYVLNGVFWTLGIELHFYLLAPLIILPLMNESGRIYLRVLVAMYLGSILWSIYAFKVLNWSFDGRNIIACLPHFLAGMIGCRMTQNMSVCSRRFWWSLLGAVLLLAATNMLYHRVPSFFWSPIGIVMVDVIIVLLIFSHANCIWREGGVWSVVFTWLGTLSYGLYAWHGYWLKTLPMLANHVFILLGLSLASAYVTYLCVETPALRLKRVHVPTR